MDWCINRKIAANAEKSSIPRIKCFNANGSIEVNGNAAIWNEEMKNLGVTIAQCYFRQTLLEDRRKGQRSQDVVIHPLNVKNSKLDLRNKMKLIKAVILPILKYASVSWGTPARLVYNAYRDRKNVPQVRYRRLILRQEWCHIPAPGMMLDSADDEKEGKESLHYVEESSKAALETTPKLLS